MESQIQVDLDQPLDLNVSYIFFDERGNVIVSGTSQIEGG
jgi:hypothetical protein